MQKLRFHHLFCIMLFSGAGYSDEFSEKMTEIKNIIYSNADTEFQFVAQPDVICESCPNGDNKTGCSLDTDTSHIAQRDKLIAERIGMVSKEISAPHSFYKAINKLYDLSSKDFFMKVCGSCRWYRQGYCSFEMWKKSVELYKKSSHKT